MWNLICVSSIYKKRVEIDQEMRGETFTNRLDGFDGPLKFLVPAFGLFVNFSTVLQCLYIWQLARVNIGLPNQKEKCYLLLIVTVILRFVFYPKEKVYGGTLYLDDGMSACKCNNRDCFCIGPTHAKMRQSE